MDGLLIDSEDAYTAVTNTILRENNRPDLPWTIKAQLQGRPGPAAGKIFHQWAQLPITREQFLKRQAELQADLFRYCKPLPGVEALLKQLGKGAHTKSTGSGRFSPGMGGRKVHLALATSSHRKNFEIKTARMKDLFSVFPTRHLIVGDDHRIPKGRGKPLPDIYLLALQSINETVAAEGEGERPITPDECLVFEDSVPGAEAGRRAGMRVVWVPHPGLLEVYSGREEEVLSGRTGEHKEDDLEHTEDPPLAGSPGKPGEIGDGWGELLNSLEEFDYEKYGIEVGDARYRSESGQSAVDGTTDKELEEMTAMADGKRHAAEEPAPAHPTKTNL
jgi:pseudouridine 5'-phosphatase